MLSKYNILLLKYIFFISIFITLSLPANSELSVEETSKGRKALFSKNYSIAKKVQTLAVKGEFENHTTLYAIIPVPLGGLYLKAGAIYVDLNSVQTLETGGSYGNTDTSGYTAGLGYSFEAGSGVNIRAEVMAAEYDSVSLTNSGVNADALTQDDTDTTITLDEMMSAKATISIVKTF